MGQLDQFAKQLFAKETLAVTHGAVAWQAPPEIGLSEVRIDGLLCVRDPSGVAALAAPWSEAREHAEIVLEIKMQGDHLDFAAIERALLRRQARQVQRAEDASAPWRGQEPLWIVASHLPAVLSEGRAVRARAPGCYEVGPAWFAFQWIAANELPLLDELVPFLVARSGRALIEFVKWVARRRPAEWLTRMVQVVPMSTAFAEALINNWIETDEPEIVERQRQLALVIVNHVPGLRDEIVDEGLAPLVHQFERRLGRCLSANEHGALRERLHALGPARLGDVVLDLEPEALAAWLADPAAT